MSVIKVFRKTSEMEFYKNAAYIRNTLTEWLLKDFGNSRKPRKLKSVIPKISEKDQEVLNFIADKYDINGDKIYKNLYPQWLADSEREYLIELVRDMMANIISANTIFVTSIEEYHARRNFQTLAIADCYKLYQELDYITRLFPSDLNQLTRLLDCIEREIELLKGWRKSGNKDKKQLLEK